MWLNALWRRWYGRTRPFSYRACRRHPARKQTQLRLHLEALEERTLLSAPPVALLGGNGTVMVSPTSQGGNVSGTYFLGGQFDTGNQTIGGITGPPGAQFGAQLNLNLNGKVGLDLGYSASTGGQVQSTYNGVSLKQNYTEPTQFGQEVNFTPQNTNVTYSGGAFSTTGPSVSASAALDASLNGSLGGTLAFFNAVSGSTSFSTSINQPLIGIGIGSTGANNGNNLGLTNLSFLGQNFADAVNQHIQDIHLTADVNPLGPEVPLFISGGLGGSSNPLRLNESLSIGVGEGEGDQAIGGALQLGSMDQFITDLALNTNSLQNGGVLTASAQGNLADLNLQMGPVVGQLLGAAGLGFLSLAGEDTLSIGPISFTLTPVSFQMGPDLTLVQTSTITPTSQLSYQFFSDQAETHPLSVDVTKNGQDMGPVSSVTFTAGADNVGVKFNGTPIFVQPTWTYTENYTLELDLDVNLQGTLTVGTLSASFGPVSTPTLGPLYQQQFNFANFKIATLYNNTSTLATETQTLSPFEIGSSFNSSLAVTTTADGNTSGSGSLRFAVESADHANTKNTQVITLGPGTYNLTIPSDGTNNGSTGGLYVGNLNSSLPLNLVIQGAGAGQTIINASGLGDRAFNVGAGANLTLEGVTVTGGSVSGTSHGGGILNSGALTLRNSSISGNSAFIGGGIENDGTLAINDGTISDNTSNKAAGAIDNFVGASLSVLDSTISNNIAGGDGGGINNAGTMTIEDSTISGNQGSFLGGGGVFNSEFGTGTIRNSTIAGNSATSSAFAAAGGGVFNSGVLGISDSTIAGNQAINAGIGAFGGGIYTPSLSFRPNMVTTLTNTIVANNFIGAFQNIPSDMYGVVASTSANNLIGDGNGETGITNGSNGNLVGQTNALLDPKLAALGNYGGPTQTMELLPGSPAIDTGTSTVPGGLPLTDQRGLPRIINGVVDIGADEYQYDQGLTGTLQPGSATGTVQYVYIVTNNGPDPVAGATLTVPLAQGTTFQSLTLPTGWTESDPGTGNNGTVTFTDTGSLNSGQSAQFSIVVQLQNTTPGTLLISTATVGPATWDNNLQNDAAPLTVANEQEGQTFKNTLLFHFTDPNLNVKANDFTASVNWGDNNSNEFNNASNDGSGTVSIVADPNGGFDVLGSHDYTEEGSYGIAVAVTGLDGTTYSSGTVVGALQ